VFSSVLFHFSSHLGINSHRCVVWVICLKLVVFVLVSMFLVLVLVFWLWCKIKSIERLKNKAVERVKNHEEKLIKQ
jgi:sensor domain CHASE-containing protein